MMFTDKQTILNLLGGVAAISLLLAVVEPALRAALQEMENLFTGWMERLVVASGAGTSWLRAQTERVIEVTTEGRFWGGAVAAAVWNLVLAIAFALAEYGLVLLSLRAAGFPEGGDLPLKAGPLTVLAFLACSVFFFEALLELFGVHTFGGTWGRTSGSVRRLLIVTTASCLTMVLASGAILGLIRGGAVSSANGGVGLSTGQLDVLIPMATIMMSVAVFVALGLSAWSVTTSALHVWGILTVIAHALLASARLSLELARLVVARVFGLLQAVLRLVTEPWRRLHAWLCRYESVRQIMRLEPETSPDGRAQLAS
jgi:hypothetical protein